MPRIRSNCSNLSCWCSHIFLTFHKFISHTKKRIKKKKINTNFSRFRLDLFTPLGFGCYSGIAGQRRLRRRLRGAFLRRWPNVRPPNGDSTILHSTYIISWYIYIYIFLYFLFYFVYNLHLFEQHFSTGADGSLIISDLVLYSCGSYYMYAYVCCTVYLMLGLQ